MRYRCEVAFRRDAETSTPDACAPQNGRVPACSCRDPSAQIQNRHANGETVGHLIENDALQSVGNVAVDLDPAVDRSGMHDQAIRFQEFRAFFR